jgi:superfamily II DNA helicase RecQ
MEAQLHSLEDEIDLISIEIETLSLRKRELIHQRDLILQRRIHEAASTIQEDEPNWEEDSFPWSVALHDLSIKLFHHDHFRPGQREIINATLSGYDVFAVMKTGGGKSFCYQLPALLPTTSGGGELTVVISPLLALIRDQVSFLNQLVPGSAVTLSGAMDRAQSTQIYRLIDQLDSRQNTSTDKAPPLRLLYLTPEKIINSKLLMSHLQRAYERHVFTRIVIDEAHCASQWGHDFRSDYSKLHILRTVFPRVPMMLVTATANTVVRQDLIQMMRLGENSGLGGMWTSADSASRVVRGLKIFLNDFDRPNLRFEVQRKPSEFNECLDLIISLIKETLPDITTFTSQHVGKRKNEVGEENQDQIELARRRVGGHIIVYCFSQKDCEAVSRGLCERGYHARAYHAGLDERLRERIQDDWTIGTNPHQIICATIAFGLGINVPTVRLVLHFSISKSLELYYQEVSPFLALSLQTP